MGKHSSTWPRQEKLALEQRSNKQAQIIPSLLWSVCAFLTLVIHTSHGVDTDWHWLFFKNLQINSLLIQLVFDALKMKMAPITYDDIECRDLQMLSLIRSFAARLQKNVCRMISMSRECPDQTVNTRRLIWEFTKGTRATFLCWSTFACVW